MFKKISLTKIKYLLTSSILNRTFFSFLLLLSLTLTTRSFFSDSPLLNSNLQVLGEETQNPRSTQGAGQASLNEIQTPTTNLPLSQREIKGVLAQCHHCITGKNIKDSAISSNKIKNKSILSSDIASNQINSRTIEDLSIQEEDLTLSLQNVINQAPLFSQWNKSSGIEIQESQITDLQNYITDGNTNWNNEYNFITASTSDTLTNKSGNISMWTNNTGYLTSYTETDPIFLSWNKSTGISITESQISNLQAYLTNLSSFTTDNLTQGTTNFYTQWTTNGTTISYSGGNVAIGTTNPLATFQVNDSTASFVITSVGQVGIGTTTPTESLHLSGNIRSNNYIGSGNRCVYVDLNGVLRVKSEDCGTSSGGDNLGNHTLTQNIIMGNNWISGDGDNEGFQINSTGILSGAQGNISMWTNDSNYITDGNTNWNNTYGFITSYTETDPIFTAWNKSTGITITESQISNLQSYLTSYTETDPIFSAHQANNITASHLTILGNTSNTNTGDETTSTIKTKLGTSSTSTDGYLTSTDWNIFNNKQPTGSYLTSYTETDPIYSAWNKSTGISITESQISNLQAYITDGNTNWNNSYGFITDLSTFTTDNLTQGTTNLYSQWATSGSSISFSGGNVGIGTTSLGNKLHIAGPAGFTYADGALRLQMSNDDLYFYRPSENRFAIQTTMDGAGIQWSSLSLQPDGGNVGIGTTSPGEKLTIGNGGNMRFEQSIGNVGAYGSILSYNLLAPTDPATAIRFVRDVANYGNDGAILFDTTNSERMRITSTGNIGIGTTGPANKFEVDGGSVSTRLRISTTNTGAQVAGIILANSSKTAFNDGLVISHGGGYTRFDDLVGNEIMRLMPQSGTVGNSSFSGNVGIGMTGPLSKLHITGSNTYVGAGLLLGSAGVASGYLWTTDNLYIKPNGAAGTASGVVAVQDFSATTKIQFNPAGDSYFNGGNIGIGTTAPLANLEIMGELIDSTPEVMLNFSRLHRANVAYTTAAAFKLSTNRLDLAMLTTNEGGDVLPNSDIMSWLNSGNVGIGTTVPGAKLNVNVSSYGDGYKLSQDGGIKSLWTTNSASSNYDTIFGAVSNNSLRFITANTERMVVLDNGNVGIGTTSPTYKLYVSGSAYSTGGWSSSDERWKNNINTLNNNTLEKILSLNPVTYEWDLTNYPNQGFQAGTQFGFIAQQVEPIFPELVHTDNTGYKSLSYEKFTPILTKAVQELNLKKADLTLLTTNQQSIDQNFNLISSKITEIEEWIPVFTRMTNEIETIQTNLSQLTINTQEQYNTLSLTLTDHEQRIQTLESLISGTNITQPELSTQMQDLDSHLQAISTEDGYLFDLDGNLKVKKMEVEEVKFKETEATICNEENSGAFYFNKVEKSFYGCDGTSWQKMQFAPNTQP